MQRITLWLLAGLALTTTALLGASEPIDTKDSKMVSQPVVERPCRWTGFYLGLHAGNAWEDLSFVERDESDPSYEFHQDGFVGGGQVGFNLQLWSFLVVGVEGTFAGTNVTDRAAINSNNEPSNGRLDMDWLATVGGRLGVTFWKNRVFVYAKGGAAFTHFDYHTEEALGNERFHAD